MTSNVHLHKNGKFVHNTCFRDFEKMTLGTSTNFPRLILPMKHGHSSD